MILQIISSWDMQGLQEDNQQLELHLKTNLLV